MPTRVQFRRGSASSWASANPILEQGEVGLDLTNMKKKIGDGTTAWNSLPFERTTVYLEDIVSTASAGQVIAYGDSEWVPATLQVGGVIGSSDFLLTPKALTGTAAAFGLTKFQQGTIALVTDYPDRSRLRYASTNAVSVTGFVPIVTILGGPIVSGLNGTPVITYYGSFSDWEALSPVYVPAEGELITVDGRLYLGNGSSGFDELAPFLNSGDTLTLAGIDSSTASVGQIMEMTGSYWSPVDRHPQTIVTGTTYTVDSSTPDGVVLVFTSSSAVTVTVANSVPNTRVINWIQKGAGQITFAAGSGTTLVNRQSHTKSAGQWAVGSLICHENSGTAAKVVLGGDTAS